MPTSTSAVITIRLSCFGGRLRRGADGWRWSDGAAESHLADRASEALDLRCREVGRDGRRLVEVPWSLAEAFDGLEWVVEGFIARRYEVDVDRGSHPALAGRVVGSTARCAAGRRVRVGDSAMVALVPEEHWRAWSAACRVVPHWEPHDEAALRQRAAALGWSP